MTAKSTLTKFLSMISSCITFGLYVWTIFISFDVHGIMGSIFAICIPVVSSVYYAGITSMGGMNTFSYTVMGAWIFYFILGCLIISENQ
jgi:hypothetical protein